jgi:redox-sensitive bicupin YhaK (pirin superfamily)
MITVRPAAERGHANHGWLDSHFTFSFADYYDPAHVSFRSLRVMNEDRVAPGQGFGMHGHRDMEILTYVLSGELAHRDSLGSQEILRPGEFQRMTAGTGIRHSEFNPSATEPVHLYQIWLLPEREGLAPSYEQKPFDAAGADNRLQLVAAHDARDGALKIQQNADVYRAALSKDKTIVHSLASDRHAWLQVLRGAVTVNGAKLSTSDGAAVSNETALEIVADADGEVLLFDLQ